MAADVPVNSQVVNSYCATWKQKYLRLKKGWNALREAVHFLQQEVERAQAENSNLKKALEEERARADIEKGEKEKASAARLSLENEISRLKSEISVKPRGNVDAQYKGEINLLKAQVSDRDKGEMENPELCPKWIALLTMEKACLSTVSLEGNDIVGFPRLPCCSFHCGSVSVLESIVRSICCCQSTGYEQHSTSSRSPGAVCGPCPGRYLDL